MLPTLLAAGLLLAGGPTPSPHEARAFPTFILIRGGTIKGEVLIHNTPTHPTRGLGIITYVPVATLVGSQDDILPQPTSPGTIVYEVAEYWGLMGMVDSTGKPNSALRWDGASQYSRLHVMPNGDVLWQALEGQFRDRSRLAYQRLTQPAIEVLADFGVPLPPEVPRFDPRATAAQLAGCWDARQRRRYGTGEMGAGLPARLVLEAGPVDAQGRRSLVVPADSGSQQPPMRGTWIFSRADMVIASIPGPDGMRDAHLSFGDLRGALRGLVAVPASSAVPTGGGTDFIELVRAKCP